MTVLFLTVSWGFRSFSLAVAKSDVTTEARRLSLFMERELRSSTYFSISTVQRQVGGDLRRDGLCFVSRNDWSRPEAYDPVNSTAAWNRYFVYYATLQKPYGQFVRLALIPTRPADLGPFPYPRFADVGTQSQYLKEDPTTYRGGDVESSRVVAASVQRFEVKRLPTTQELELRLILRQNGLMARRANGDREGGTFELQYRVQPQNTL